jgi:dihydrofolate synthase/folylpolyglutamate synthase
MPPQERPKPGLERIRALCEALNHPERAFPSVLVAGTNGKGSTAAFLESTLRAAGLGPVGLYTSPHLVSETERIQVDRAPISEARLHGLSARVEAAAVEKGVEPSYFETMTAAMFLRFAEQGVTRAVVEIGLGGRWDATWVAHAELGLVTSIGLEHADWLGPTLEHIAREKAAIARPGMTLLSAVERELHDREIRTEALRCGAATVTHLEDTGVRVEAGSAGGPAARVVLPDGTAIQPPLAGAHQARNAALVAAAALHLGVAPEAIRAGIQAATWPGRFQLLREAPPLLLDVAHNPHGFAALADTLAERFPGVRWEVVLGLKADKDVLAIANEIKRFAVRVQVTEGEDLRPAEELVPVFTNAGIVTIDAGPLQRLAERVDFLNRPARGFHHRKTPEDRCSQQADGERCGPGQPVLVCGSHYVVGAVLGAGLKG